MLIHAERDNVVSAHERDGAFSLDGLDRRIASIFVRCELVIPDVTGSFVIDHFERPGRYGRKLVTLDQAAT